MRVITLKRRAAPNLRQSPSAYFQTNIHITTRPPLQLALQMLGPDRVMFSIDYPYSGNDTGRAFLDGLKLPATDFEKLTHKNAERLLKIG